MSREALHYEHWKSMWLWCEMRGSFDVSPAKELADGYWRPARTAARNALLESYGASQR
jgi:hypothetical protein